jgi:glycosyltransferase involved in cell wall biosynthesis
MTAGPVTVSIAMPSLDQRPFLAEAVASVLGQEGVDVELIVWDPGSRDGSRELLQSIAGNEPRLLLAFESDAGQSDAVNRALARARGGVFGWLNSDDRLRPGALARVAATLCDPSAPAWLYGRAGMIDADGRAVTSWIARYKAWRGRRFTRWKLLTENFIPQMAAFWTRALWERAGGLDVARHLDMDYDLWLRFARLAEPVVLADVLADFRVHAQAKGSKRTAEQLAAALATARAHARDLGWRGRVALALHRAYALRTRLCYALLKPRQKGVRSGRCRSHF